MPEQNFVESPLENTENYISPLDNPNITLEFALRYVDSVKSEYLEQEIKALNEETGFKPILNESLGNRCLEILYLTNNLPSDYLIPSNVILRAIFKTALPWHRLQDQDRNDKEIEIVTNFLNRDFNSFFKHIIPTNDVFSEEAKTITSTVAKTICWTGSNVGQFLVCQQN